MVDRAFSRPNIQIIPANIDFAWMAICQDFADHADDEASRSNSWRGQLIYFNRHLQRSKCPLCLLVQAFAFLPPPKPLNNQHRIYPSLLPGAHPRRSEHKRSSVPMRSRLCMFACLRCFNISCSLFVTLCSLPRNSVPIGPRDCSCLTVKLFLCIRIFRYPQRSHAPEYVPQNYSCSLIHTSLD